MCSRQSVILILHPWSLVYFPWFPYPRRPIKPYPVCNFEDPIRWRQPRGCSDALWNGLAMLRRQKEMPCLRIFRYLPVSLIGHPGVVGHQSPSYDIFSCSPLKLSIIHIDRGLVFQFTGLSVPSTESRLVDPEG